MGRQDGSVWMCLKGGELGRWLVSLIIFGGGGVLGWLRALECMVMIDPVTRCSVLAACMCMRMCMCMYIVGINKHQSVRPLVPGPSSGPTMGLAQGCLGCCVVGTWRWWFGPTWWWCGAMSYIIFNNVGREAPKISMMDYK